MRRLIFASMILVTGCTPEARERIRQQAAYEQMIEDQYQMKVQALPQSAVMECRMRGQAVQSASYNPVPLIDLESIAMGNKAANLCIQMMVARADEQRAAAPVVKPATRRKHAASN